MRIQSLRFCKHGLVCSLGSPGQTTVPPPLLAAWYSPRCGSPRVLLCLPTTCSQLPHTGIPHPHNPSLAFTRRGALLFTGDTT